MKAMTASAALLAALVSVAMVSPAHADDTSAQKALDQANALYAQRADLTKNDQAITVLAAAEGTATNNDINFDILILESRALYWKGQHATNTNDEKTVYLSGQTKALAARKLNDSYAEGPYYAGINLARWGEANGIIASISHKGELIQDMTDAIDPSRATRDGNDGETIDGYGPDRVLGRMYYKLPAILGGSHDTSVHGSDHRRAEGSELLAQHPLPGRHSRARQRRGEDAGPADADQHARPEPEHLQHGSVARDA